MAYERLYILYLQFAILFMRSFLGVCMRKLIYFVDTIVYCFMLKVICLLKQYFENGFKCLISAANEIFEKTNYRVFCN